MRGSGDYDRKKKDTVVCLLGARFWQLRPEKKRYSRLSGRLCCCILSVFGSGEKLAVFLLWREIFITTGKKKDTVVCLAGCAVVLCQLLVLAGNWQLFFVAAGNFYYHRKKKIQSSVWRVRDHYYDRKKKFYFVVAGKFYYDRKKNVLVVCLAGARSLLRPEKKVLVICLAGCAVVSVFGSDRK